MVAARFVHAEAGASAELFSGPESGYSESVARAGSLAGAVLRTFQVEERAGATRRGELVRVPVFFSAGECTAIEQLTISAEDGSQTSAPIPFQADDVRRAPDGGISRVHLWFETDLDAGERKRFRLTKNKAAAASAVSEAMRVTQSADGALVIETTAGPVTFNGQGGLVSLRTKTDTWRFGPKGARPSVVIAYPTGENDSSEEVSLDRAAEASRMRWAAGPLFTKVSLRLTDPDGVSLEQDFRIPSHGREIVITTAIFPGAKPGYVLKKNVILETGANVAPIGNASVRLTGAGVRKSLRAEHAYTVTALIDAANSGALLAIPLVLGGTNGIWSLAPDGQLSLLGPQDLRQGSEGEKRTLFAYWTEVRLVPVGGASDQQLWATYLRHVQPLVAVVDEPAVTVDQLHAALRGVVEEMKPIGWRQEAGRARVLGETNRATSLLQRSNRGRASDLNSLVQGAQNAGAKLTNNGQRVLREDEKGRAYGGLDPYHITYTQSAAAALAVLTDAPPAVTEVNLAMARGVRQVGGRVDEAGFPYVDCFNRTLNMQLGPVLFGLTAGAKSGDAALVRFYRDLATSPLVKGIFGRGQRPYTGGPTTAAEQTDYLYQSICDFWLRTTEVLGNENFELHPLAYSRYTDCIDVLADRYHGFSPKPKEGSTTEVRANFFRGQAHTHRWLGWSCSPFIRLLESSAEHSTVGLTEAVHFARNMQGQWKNWPDLTFYVLADLLVNEGLERYQRPELPSPPAQLTARRAASATELSWQSMADAVEYRIYRAEKVGGPYRWLNSRYVASPLPRLTEAHFIDADASATDASQYVVTSVDAAGRESAWSNAKAIGSVRP